MRKNMKKLTILLFSLFMVSCASHPDKTEITVLAAASMKDALEAIKESYQGDVIINYSYGASGTLQTQIEQGAPADIFLSASPKQMRVLEEKNLLDSSTKRVLLENELVLITNKNEESIQKMKDISSSKISGIALGDIAHVPAGQYAKESLIYLDLYDDITDKIVYGSDVRTVLSWVEEGVVDAGIVYSSDAKTSDKARVVDVFPSASHSPIQYPMAMIKNSKEPEAAKDFLKFLQGEEATQIFIRNGFKTP